jgi:hypothetical protein
VAAYHAGDYAEAAREIRAYRRMSGDDGYRAVLADCERALGRPDVAIRLVAEALAESPDSDEIAELRLVEAGARRDLGENAAARLVLEGALGGRPDPTQLTEGDSTQLRFAAAYADLLEAEGDAESAATWRDAITAADPDALADEVEFAEFDEDEDDETTAEPDADALVSPEVETESENAATTVELEDEVEDDFVDDTADDPAFPTSGLSFQEEIEAEVAELLGEGPDEDEAGAPGEDAPEH